MTIAFATSAIVIRVSLSLTIELIAASLITTTTIVATSVIIVVTITTAFAVKPSLILVI